MPGRILVVDSVSTMRILLRAELQTDSCRVTLAPGLDAATSEIRRATPDAVVVSLDLPMVSEFIRTLRKQRGAPIPVIGLKSPITDAFRMKMLRAGVDDIMPRPAPTALILARIRSLLRANHDADGDAPSSDYAQTLGMAEAPAPNLPKARIALATECDDAALSQVLMRMTDAHLTSVPHGAFQALAKARPDVAILDGRPLGRGAARQLLDQIPNLRANTALHNVKLMVLFAPEQAAAVVAALDLGADDALCAPACDDEIAYRAGRLLQRKQRADQYRATVKSSMVAATLDPLTGLYNRRVAMHRLGSALARTEAGGPAFSILLIDVDHFKTINDTHGHSAGDRVLTGLAQRLRQRLRDPIFLARLGGEEFLVLFGATSLDRAAATADELRRLIADRPFQSLPDSPPIHVTASFGAAEAQPGFTAEQLLHAADCALYRAKAGGRNSIELSQEPVSP